MSEARTPRGAAVVRARSRSLLLLALAAAAPLPLPAQDRSDTPNRVGVTYSFTTFDEELAEWHEAAVHYRRAFSWGFLMPRVRWAERFRIDGAQAELDAYPFLGEGRYAYLNVGYSDDVIFPEWRLGAEVYTALPRAWEASGGVRWMDFRTVEVLLFTGSVAKYAGNWWIAARPWLATGDGPEGPEGFTIEGLVRRYGAGTDDFWGFRGGWGEVATELRTAADLAARSSWALTFEGRKPLGEAWIGAWGIGVREESLEPAPDRTRFELRLGVERYF